MIRTLTAACFALLLLGAAAAAQVTAALTPPHPKLKPAAVVTGGIVRIGDLVENAGVIADIPIFRSPDLGTTGTVSAEAVVEAVRAHALRGLDTGGLSEVTVTRASRTFKPEDIENCVARALAAKFSLGAPGDISLNFDSDLHPLHVESTAKGELHIDRISYDGRTSRFYATLTVPNGPATSFPLKLSGRAIATVEVATVAVPIARGATLKDADILMERQPRTQLGHNYITDREKVVGMAARTALEPGRPLRSAELMKPLVIERNEQVTLVYQIPGIMLTVRGKATEGGAVGDVITVLNEQSKRLIQGEVVGPGHVVISMRGRRLAENIVPSYRPPNVSNR
jgi:flagellar basal body P-ring formation protein FlgA